MTIFCACVVRAQALFGSRHSCSDTAQGSGLTWHDDNLRTGWQQQETILTTSTIGSLGISFSVGLADQVDARPLVIPGFISGHDIVFVADESNTVYQIDASTGAILKQVNLGVPVPEAV